MNEEPRDLPKPVRRAALKFMEHFIATNEKDGEAEFPEFGYDLEDCRMMAHRLRKSMEGEEPTA